MGSVFKKTYTKPLPLEAELVRVARKNRRDGEPEFDVFARVKPAKGRAITYRVTFGRDGSQRIVVEAGTYLAKFRDGAGVVREVSTGCRDEGAARCVLNELERRSELVRSGVLSADEDRIADHQRSPIVDQFEAWDFTQQAKGLSESHRKDSLSNLNRLARECRFKTLGDLNREAFEKWLGHQAAAGMSARTRNSYREKLCAFCNWCVETGRLLSNPFAGVHRADEKADQRRPRRAMTETELGRLLTVARLRPLAEYGRESVVTDRKAGKRGGWRYKQLAFDEISAAVERGRDRLAKRPDFIEQLEHRGRERQLLYKTLVTTGLRKGELASVRLRDLDLDGDRPSLTLKAKNEKNRQGNTLPLRADLAVELRDWLTDRATKRRLEAQNAPTIKFKRKAELSNRRDANEDRSGRLMPDEFLFDVPDGLVKILDRDLKAAGIPKRDDRGRTLDVHAFRTTFGTHLSKAGVPLRTAQAAMRHCDPKLTANLYTDPRLLDVHGAVEALPTLSLTATRNDGAEVMRATGTMGALDSQLAPLLAPNSGNPCLSMACISTELEQKAPVASSPGNEESLEKRSVLRGSQDLPTVRVERTTACLQNRCSAN